MYTRRALEFLESFSDEFVGSARLKKVACLIDKSSRTVGRGLSLNMSKALKAQSSKLQARSGVKD